MNFPFTDLDFAGDDPSAPIIPSNGASAAQPRANSKTKKNVLDTSQVTNSKVRDYFLYFKYFTFFLKQSMTVQKKLDSKRVFVNDDEKRKMGDDYV